MTAQATPTEVHTICQMYREGKSCHTIAEAFHRTAPGILKILRQQGVPIAAAGSKQPLLKMTPEATARAAELYAQGKSLAEVGEALGVAAAAVHRAFIKQRVPIRGCKNRTPEWKEEEEAKGLLKCSRCLEFKEPSQFPKMPPDYGQNRGRAYLCKDCDRWKSRLASYGITKETYVQKFKDQQGLCAICKKPWEGNVGNPDLVVDHDHASGKIRDLLCPHCNHLLGHAFDSPKILLSAAAYLTKHGKTDND